MIYSNVTMPKKKVITRYQFKTGKFSTTETTTATSQGDPTNTCTTILTSTHFVSGN